MLRIEAHSRLEPIPIIREVILLLGKIGQKNLISISKRNSVVLVLPGWQERLREPLPRSPDRRVSARAMWSSSCADPCPCGGVPWNALHERCHHCPCWAYQAYPGWTHPYPAWIFLVALRFVSAK